MSVWGRGERFFQIFRETWAHLRATNRARRAVGGYRAEVIHPQMYSWGRRMLDILNLELNVTGEPSKEPVLFIGNHLSYVDIPLLMSVVPVVFITKEEVTKWPIIGSACRAVGTVSVQRESRESRKEAGLSIARCLSERKQSVVVFPSGTTKLDEATPWRRGGFEIAKAHDIWIQPFHLYYYPLRTVAYVDDDAFVPHLWKLLGEKKIKAVLEFGVPRPVERVDDDSEALWLQSRQWIQQAAIFHPFLHNAACQS